MTDDEPIDEQEAELLATEPTVDAGSRQGVEGQHKRIDRERREGEEFWRRCLADPIGRRVIWQFLSTDARVFEERFAVGPNGFPQPEASWFHAGEQALGLRLYQHLMRVDRAGVFVMHDEHDGRFVKPKPPRRKRAD